MAPSAAADRHVPEETPPAVLAPAEDRHVPEDTHSMDPGAGEEAKERNVPEVKSPMDPMDPMDPAAAEDHQHVPEETSPMAQAAAEDQHVPEETPPMAQAAADHQHVPEETPPMAQAAAEDRHVPPMAQAAAEDRRALEVTSPKSSWRTVVPRRKCREPTFNSGSRSGSGDDGCIVSRSSFYALGESDGDNGDEVPEVVILEPGITGPNEATSPLDDERPVAVLSDKLNPSSRPAFKNARRSDEVERALAFLRGKRIRKHVKSEMKREGGLTATTVFHLCMQRHVGRVCGYAYLKKRIEETLGRFRDLQKRLQHSVTPAGDSTPTIDVVADDIEFTLDLAYARVLCEHLQTDAGCHAFDLAGRRVQMALTKQEYLVMTLMELDLRSLFLTVTSDTATTPGRNRTKIYTFLRLLRTAPRPTGTLSRSSTVATYLDPRDGVFRLAMVTVDTLLGRLLVAGSMSAGKRRRPQAHIAASIGKLRETMAGVRQYYEELSSTATVTDLMSFVKLEGNPDSIYREKLLSTFHSFLRMAIAKCAHCLAKRKKTCPGHEQEVPMDCLLYFLPPNTPDDGTVHDHIRSFIM